MTSNQQLAITKACPACGTKVGTPCGQWTSDPNAWIICKRRYAAVGVKGR